MAVQAEKRLIGVEKNPGLRKFFAVIGAVAGIFACYQMGGFKTVSPGSSLKAEIQSANKTLPTMLDGETQFDRITLRDRNVHYDYTLVNVLSDEIDVSQLESFATSSVRPSVCTNGKTLKLLNEGRELVHRYQDKAGALLIEIRSTKANCRS